MTSPARTIRTLVCPGAPLRQRSPDAMIRDAQLSQGIGQLTMAELQVMTALFMEPTSSVQTREDAIAQTMLRGQENNEAKDRQRLADVRATKALLEEQLADLDDEASRLEFNIASYLPDPVCAACDLHKSKHNNARHPFCARIE